MEWDLRGKEAFPVKDDQRTLYKVAGLAFSFGVNLAAAMFIGYYAGAFLDRKLGTAPYLAMVGFMLGVTAAFRILVRELQKMAGGNGKKGDPDGQERGK